MTMRRSVATGFSAITAGMVLAFAPTAGAQPPPPAECPPAQPATAEQQQQCEQQQPKVPGMPELPDVPTNNAAPPENPNGVDLADKDCWVVRGVPTMWSPTMSTAPGEQAWPCYYVYGLTPH